uniref:NR LBD domain-containing protein n=1 Tax=Caenorhabditis tropicalis TaxID=1561998 RepID=A0A1I7UAU7_9PELO
MNRFQNEESIINSARVLQHVKFECLISKEISEQEQETLRAFCRSGDQEEKAENLIEKIVLAVLNAVVTKNDFVRQLAVPGELRMFAVDEKKAKLPMMALLMARKDLLYVSWSKANRDFEDTLVYFYHISLIDYLFLQDGTWAGMAVKKES